MGDGRTQGGQAEETKYRELLDTTSDWVWEVDECGRCTYSSARVRDLLGYEPEEVMGKVFLDFMPPEEAKRSSAIFERVAAEGEPFSHLESTFIHRDGHEVYVEASGVPVFDAGGVLRGYRGVDRDVTEVRRIEHALRESEERYRALVEFSPYAITVSQDGVFVYVNPAAVVLGGGESADQFIGLPAYTTIHPDWIEETRAFIEQSPDTESIFRNEDMKILRLDGSPVDVELSARFVTYQGKRSVLSIAHEITERKQIQEAQARLAAIVEGTTDYASIADMDCGVVYINSAGRRMIGLGPDEDITGVAISDVHPGWAADIICDEGVPTALREGSWNGETALLARDGREIPVSQVIIAHRDSTGVVDFIATVMRDISERKHSEQMTAAVSRIKEQLLLPASLSDKLKAITDGLVNEFGADFARVWVVKESDTCEQACPHALVSGGTHVCRDRTKCLHLLASSGRYTHIDGGHARVPLGAYKIGRVASGEDEKFVTNDVTHDPRVHNHEWAAELGLVSFAGFRLVSPEGTPIGVMALFRKWAISHEEESLLQDVADTASHVIVAGMATEALAESESRYRLLFDRSPDMIFILKDEHFLSASSAVRDVLGYEPEEVIGLGPWEISPEFQPDGMSSYDKAFMHADKLREVGPFVFDWEHVHKNGSRVDCEVHLAPYEMGGEPYMQTIVRDISERKRAEQEREMSIERLQSLWTLAQMTESREADLYEYMLGASVRLTNSTYGLIGKVSEDGQRLILRSWSPEVSRDCRMPESEFVLQIERLQLLGRTVRQKVYVIDNACEEECQPRLPMGHVPIERVLAVPLITEGAVREILAVANKPSDYSEQDANQLLLLGASAMSIIGRRELRRSLEEQNRKFYRETILSATQGKLEICDASNVEPYIAEARCELEMYKPADVSRARREIESFCRDHGMEEETVYWFVLAAIEAATNAIKHGERGLLCVGVTGSDIWVAVSDNGTGIESLVLPKAVLRTGFSTKPSMGLGYSIMLDVADQVLLKTDREGTTVVLVKSIIPPEPSVPLDQLPDTWDAIPSAE